MPVVRHLLSWIWGWLIYILPAISNFVLVLLGVVMSLPALADKVEKTPRLRKSLGAVCLTAGLVGLGFEVVQRRSNDVEMQTLISDTTQLVAKQDELLTSTKTLVDNSNQLATLMPEISALNTQVATFSLKIGAAKGNPQLTAALGADLELLYLRGQLLSASANVRNTWSSWDTYQHEDHEKIAHSHDYNYTVFQFVRNALQDAKTVRDQALRIVPRTDDDIKGDAALNNIPAGGPDAAAYLQSLADRVSALTPKISN